MLVYSFWVFPHLLQLAEDGIQGPVQLLAAAEDWAHALDKAAELFFKSEEFAESLFEDIGEVKESQSVASWSSIEDNDLKLHVFNWSFLIYYYPINCPKDIA